VDFKQEPGKSFELNITIPANTTANVYMPSSSENFKLTVDGKNRKAKISNGNILINDIQAGSHSFILTK